MGENKIALITGATRGIGKQIAITLAENGFDIALNYRKENEDLENTKMEIEKLGRKCVAVKGDVSSYEDCENFVKEVIAQYGKIDVLVNNAGITKDNLLMRMKKEDFEDVLNVNLVGTFNVTKNVIPYMMKENQFVHGSKEKDSRLLQHLPIGSNLDNVQIRRLIPNDVLFLCH